MSFRSNFWWLAKRLVWIPIAYYTAKGWVDANKEKRETEEERPYSMPPRSRRGQRRHRRTRDRFNHHKTRRGYDAEYARIRNTFDKIDQTNTGSIKHLKDLAIKSQQLTQKYKSLNDREGADQSARLHEEIEEASEKLVPIYESWRKRKLTIAAIVLAGSIGYCRGDYIQYRVGRFFSTPTNIEYSSGLLGQSSGGLEGKIDDNYRTGILPHQVTEAGTDYPEARYTLYFNFEKNNGGLIDMAERELLFIFPFTGNMSRTPRGTFTVASYGSGKYSPMNRGSGYFELNPNAEMDLDRLIISGTYSNLLYDQMRQKRHSTNGNIVIEDNNIIRIFQTIKDRADSTLVVIEN